MRELYRYSSKDWLRFKPIIYWVRGLRNRIFLYWYVGNIPKEYNDFMGKNHHLKGKNIIIAISFEQPWVIRWLGEAAQKNILDAELIIFDNSMKLSSRASIRQACEDIGIPYFGLPKNPTSHVNRSHSLAMQWIYENFIVKIKPEIFAFIDHDLIPIKHVEIGRKINNQDFYGLLRPGGENEHDPRAWSLWAGYCIFKYNSVMNTHMNFMYDFSRGLDTGGGNYETLYRHYEKNQLKFPAVYDVQLNIEPFGIVSEIQQVDEEWYHIGSVGYNENMQSKEEYVKSIANTLANGSSWDDLVFSRSRSW